MSLLAQIDQISARCPEQVCLIHHRSVTGSTSISYKQLVERADLLATSLLDSGVSNGQYVGIYMQRSIDHVVAMIAIWKCSAAFFSLNPKLTSYQIDYNIKLCSAPVMLIDNTALIKLSKLDSDQIADCRLIHYSSDKLTPIQSACMSKLQRRFDLESIPIDDQLPSTAPYRPTVSEREVATLLFTSGSTGTPKGVMISHGDLQTRVEQEIEDFRLCDSDKLLNLLPFSFDVGLNQLFTALTAGVPLVISNSWLAGDICSAIEQHYVSGVSSVPAIWSELLNYDQEIVHSCLNRLRYFTISGGDMSPDQLIRLRRIAPDCAIYKTYGQTETFRSGILMPEDFGRKYLSVGKSVNGTNSLVLNDTGEIAKPDEAGEIIHCGNGTMMGYVNDKKATNEKVRKHPLQDWSDERVVFTGDIGKIDVDGYLYILGRKDRMMKVRGNRVYPQEVLNVILSFDGVEDGVVFGIKGKDNESSIYAEIVMNKESETAIENLTQFLSQRLPSYMVPEKVIVVESLPRTVTGKVKLDEIEEKYHEKR